MGWRSGYKRPNPTRDKELRRIRDANQRKELKDWYWEIKSKHICSKCGEDHPACLEFHHRDPKTKWMEVSVMVTHVQSYSLEKAKSLILAEIEKCEVLCSNCHKKHHFTLRGNRSWQSSVEQLPSQC